MHISQLNTVQKLSSELAAVRAQIAAVDDTGLQFRARNGASVTLSEGTVETFKKLAMIELVEKEASIENQLGEYGVDTEEAECECEASETTRSVSPADVMSMLFGGIPGLHSGGIVGRRL